MADDQLKAFARCIQIAFEQSGLTTVKLAELCGGRPSRVTISRILNGEGWVTEETFGRVAAALGLTLRVYDNEGNEIFATGPGPAKSRKRAKGRTAAA